uniref:EF-hand domain-containing protein n=1 Tax=Paramoeba aestuarina TaxID=180227 RepID=A0A7S4NII4_9EUKA|mmetsp:Transcript_16657/g.25920  ORF Transcript_16657/g.25920 Transcript_16657/m.25920 type:complete len:197 (+) Transcript_16657:52-642(+)|eukprot:CAMPEP_0201520832 /NCGR_PEP_ID=MMETSP0161_2-20130828/12843_1 /ASSEMBLY_ACC=CAM_ASM_000251 /TAXON_ID=180227 /ORGANISM="Neoparamoeba aestuarina, Strain SoJaBio B1-5/56/2" /LENGTH=196 /DNA_ID=CAMNT_0047919337 /DNA_START=81 /DNA_END=671 /DNA_ORIENTATION=+
MAGRGKLVIPPGMMGGLRPMGGPPKPLSKIMFEKYDTDNSGSIDADEFKHLTQELGYRLTDEQLKWAVSQIDDSGDGLIEYEEFIAWWKKDDRMATLKLDDEAIFFRAQAFSVFQQYDKDNDGSIDDAEFADFYQDLIAKGLTDKDQEAAKKDLDADGDGSIQFNEYIRWLQRNKAPRERSLLAEYMEKHLPEEQQ